MNKKVAIITYADIFRCPIKALSFTHYYRDANGVVHCNCESRKED